MKDYINLENVNISVVLCTYNGSKYLKKQLDSILHQTLSPSEIIIVDDYSKDDTVKILKEYASNNKKIKLYFNEENIGPILSFKKAIFLAENEYIALCDQDDIWFNNKLELQLSEISKLEDPTSKPLVHFHDLKLMDQNDKVINDSFWSIHKINVKNINFKFLFMNNIITGCTCVINNQMKKELLKSDMKSIMMHDYLIALIAYGFGIVVYHENPLMYYRSHSTSVTSKRRMSVINRLKTFFKEIYKKDYLLPNILQMKQFLNLYYDLIYEDNRKDIEEFVSLKESSLLRRIKYKWVKKI